MPSTTTSVVIVGALGRMGREIAAVVAADPDVAVVGCIESAGHPGVGKEYGLLVGLDIPNVVVEEDITRTPVDNAVVINFASPAAVDPFLDAVAGKQVGLVIGTTGLGEDTTAKISRHAQSAPVVFSPNMSLGVNLLFHLTRLVGSKIGESFDIEIIEAHHRRKQDSPSGTAKRLGEIAASCIGTSYSAAVRSGREGLVGERTDKEIGMHAVRGGDIVGDHTVLFAGSGERLELRHVAHSRATFARGAVAAAKWLAHRPNGLYSMADVLGLPKSI